MGKNVKISKQVSALNRCIPQQHIQHVFLLPMAYRCDPSPAPKPSESKNTNYRTTCLPFGHRGTQTLGLSRKNLDFFPRYWIHEGLNELPHDVEEFPNTRAKRMI